MPVVGWFLRRALPVSLIVVAVAIAAMAAYAVYTVVAVHQGFVPDLPGW
jgi:hypothetical protein